MSQISETTKKYRRLAIFILAIQIIVLLAPITTYAVQAFIVGNTVEKLALGGLATASIILCCLNLLMKMKLRSPIWLCLLGIFFILENILPLIILLAVGTIADELLLTPLYKRFKNQAQINAEIDKRM